MEKIFPIVLLVIVAIVAVFFWQSGILSKIGSFKITSPKFVAPIPKGGLPGGIPIAAPPVIVPPAGHGTGTPPPPVTGQLEIPTSSIPTGFTRSELSPSFKKVVVASAYPGSGYAGSWGQIFLYTHLAQNETIDVTGWQLNGRRGSGYLPQAVAVYDPSGLTGLSDIVLHSGNQLSIYSTASPIGVNLRLNKCIGYIGNTAKFNPPLPLSCPSPFTEPGVSSFSGVCQNYIRSLGSCRMPAANPPIPQNDYACQDFLNTINYRGCFDRHRADSDFLSNQWIVWTGSNFLDQYHDRLLLLDRQGLLVDLYSY